MAYKYRLETVLNVRKNLEEQAQYKLAQEITTLEDLRQHLVIFKERKVDLIATVERKKKTAITGAMYTFYMESLQNIDQQVEFQNTSIKGQEQVVEEARGQLAERVKEKRIVVKMKEKDYQQYIQDLMRKEQNENDEMAVLRHGRGHGQ